MKRFSMVFFSLLMLHVLCVNGSGAPERNPSAQRSFRQMEERLLHARVLRVRFDIAAKGAITADLQGELTFSRDGRVFLQAKGFFRSQPVSLMLYSDNWILQGGSETRQFRIDTPAALQEGLVIGLTRMGLLHNLAQLTNGAPPDGIDGNIRVWLQVKDLRAGSYRLCKDSKTEAIRFNIIVENKPAGETILCLDKTTGLPRRRSQTVHFPGGDMQVTEYYSEFVLETGVINRTD